MHGEGLTHADPVAGLERGRLGALVRPEGVRGGLDRVVRQVGLPAQVTGAGDLFGPAGERPRQQHNKKPGLSAGQ